jgi:hypothetical protein
VAARRKVATLEGHAQRVTTGDRPPGGPSPLQDGVRP